MSKYYKVIEIPVGENTIPEFIESAINSEANEGWELHSALPSVKKIRL
jgi:hypothetical protein